MKKKLKSLLDNLSPLFMDENLKGQKKVSIGRAPLLTILVTLCYRYIATGENPGEGILAFIAMALAYNGFSKFTANTNETTHQYQAPTPIAADEEGD